MYFRESVCMVNPPWLGYLSPSDDVVNIRRSSDQDGFRSVCPQSARSNASVRTYIFWGTIWRRLWWVDKHGKPISIKPPLLLFSHIHLPRASVKCVRPMWWFSRNVVVREIIVSFSLYVYMPRLAIWTSMTPSTPSPEQTLTLTFTLVHIVNPVQCL